MNKSSEAVQVELQVAAALPELPDVSRFELWVNSAVNSSGVPPAGSFVTVRIVNEAESGSLNGRFRQIEKPTNVLAFPAESDDFRGIDEAERELGDLVICGAVVEREAAEQSKSLEAHFAHMTVHGSLHLLGFDHIADRDAVAMEALETSIMMQLGYRDPYGDEHQNLQQA